MPAIGHVGLSGVTGDGRGSLIGQPKIRCGERQLGIDVAHTLLDVDQGGLFGVHQIALIVLKGSGFDVLGLADKILALLDELGADLIHSENPLIAGDSTGVSAAARGVRLGPSPIDRGDVC